MHRAAAGISRLGITFDLVLSSPLKRAMDTARIVADATTASDTGSDVTIEPQLVGGCTAAVLLGLLSGHGASRSVLVVGHQPDMGRIAAELTGFDEALPFGRGTLCGLEFANGLTPGAASLVFLMPADLLARAG